MSERGPRSAALAEKSSSGVRHRAVAAVVVVAVLAALIEVVPMGFTLYGGVLVLARVQGRWDPTWNDGDGWFAAAAALVVVLLAVLTALAAGAIARAARLPVVRTSCVAVGCSSAVAAIPGLLLAVR